MKLVLLLALAVVCWRLLVGRWPGQGQGPGQGRATGVCGGAAARRLLRVGAEASRNDIIAAHRATLARVHPDRGGSSEAVHAANAARDVLLAELAARNHQAR